MLNSYLIFLTLLFSLLTHAVPENTLPQMQDEILNFYEQGESVTYTGVSGKDVHYHALRRGHKNAIVILPGRTEPTKKYAEVTYDLRELKADFFLWDPPGQGYSERLLEDAQKGYIESYKDYASDFKKFSDKELKSYEKIAFVAHSMGAAISLHFVANNPDKVKGMVLSSPMMELKTNNLPESVALMAARALALIGKKKDYIPGGGPFKSPTPYEENRVTSSPNRYAFARFIDKGDPKLYMGSATNQWLIQAIKLTRKIMRDRKKLEKVPMIFFQAGLDEFSKDERQQKFCLKHSKCTLVRFENSKHEMFQERDEIRNQVIEKTKAFVAPLFQ